MGAATRVLEQPVVNRVARRLARAEPARRVRRRLFPPTVSVIVPFYNVDAYLAECLESVLTQSYGDMEVLLVDDGSLDGSRRIAEQYAARDWRVRILTRPNGGLGAARNTGVRAARGRYLTFVDSDDRLPKGALAALVESAEETGSDIVVGAVTRFDSTRTWTLPWVREVHDENRRRVRLDEFRPLLRNLYTWNKLFRADFWRAQDLWFREGVAYEDQPIITQLLARAGSLDVLSRPVYHYRARDDQSSISQQTATIGDLRQRIEAWRVSARTLRGELPRATYDTWLWTLFEFHFQWYLTSPGAADPAYWAELSAAIRELAGDAPDHVWHATRPDRRVLVRLALDDRQADAVEFVRVEANVSAKWPSTVCEDGVRLHLPLYDDPDLPEELFLLRPAQLRLAHAVERLTWEEGPGGVDLRVAGWAYVRKIDLAVHHQQVSLVLRHRHTGEEVVHKSIGPTHVAYPPPFDDAWCDPAPGTFEVVVPASELLAGAGPDDVWEALLRVEVAGFTVTDNVTKLVRSGSAGHLTAHGLADGSRLLMSARPGRPLRLRRSTRGLHVGTVSLTGRTLSAVLPADHGITRVVARSRRRVVEEPVAGDRLRLTLPTLEIPVETGRVLEWRFEGITADGETRDLVPVDAGLSTAPVSTGRDVLLLGTDPRGNLVVRECVLSAVADRVRVETDGRLWASGRVLGAGPAAYVAVETRHHKTRTRGAEVAVDAGLFEAPLLLEHDVYRFGPRPLPLGRHELWLSVRDGDGEPVSVPLRMSSLLAPTLPCAVATAQHEGRVVRGPDSIAQINLVRPLGKARGKYNQRRLQLDPPVGDALVRGVLFRSYFGETATDNGVAIQRELRRRGSDLPVYWAVTDHSVVVPEGGIPVVVNTAEWYRLLSSVAYYVDNMYQPTYHRKPPGQVLVQTFHGYPFKQMGHPHWDNIGFSRERIESYDRRAAEWDYLVSPARYATPLLTRDFAYDGEVLEIGYPRNDVLLSAEAPRLREQVRASLGIRSDQTAVLYAPTFRDYLSPDDKTAVIPDFLDLERAAAALGDGYVLLARGHAFNARTEQRFGRGAGILDVTDYPDVADLYLAADAAVVDYSSLRFDFGVTGKPMIFQVPDLQRYLDTRGWLFDFEPTAPGPMVDTTEEVVAALRDLDGVRASYAAAYRRFRKDYLDLEDGHAAERFVDAVFVPRGDA